MTLLNSAISGVVFRGLDINIIVDGRHLSDTDVVHFGTEEDYCERAV